MKAGRVTILLIVLVLAAGALWYSHSRHQTSVPAAQTAEAAPAAYDYEAHDVVLRQMGADGRLAFQIKAKDITQLADNGRITAHDLTLYHDPPGTEPGGPNRWTLTADSGVLPAEGGTITLTGKVRAHGIPVGGNTAVTFASEHLQYDMTTQELRSDDEVLLTRAGSSMRLQSLRFNIKSSELAGSEINATLVPR